MKLPSNINVDIYSLPSDANATTSRNPITHPYAALAEQQLDLFNYPLKLLIGTSGGLGLWVYTLEIHRDLGGLARTKQLNGIGRKLLNG